MTIMQELLINSVADFGQTMGNNTSPQY